MSVGRKIFIVLSSFIIGFSTVFVLLTYIVIRDSMDVMLQTSREEELNQLEARLLSYYVKNGNTFRAIQDQEWLSERLPVADHQESILLVSREQTVLLLRGTRWKNRSNTWGLNGRYILKANRLRTCIIMIRI
ncbi:MULTISPECIES: hypothetical protein [Paenibacillus]|uniref:hypothetical protein n=1 Tax=Paenibacillus TaxID=44249 RepID=UPI00211638DB|nr:hypothetical protein [Paenibacillus lautus]